MSNFGGGDVGEATVDIRASDRKLLGDVARIKAALNSIDTGLKPIEPKVDTGKATAQVKSLSGELRGLLAIGTGVLAFRGIEQIGKQIGTFAVQSVAKFEQVKVAFQGMFSGNTQVATQFLSQLQQFAAKTPFEFDQLTGSAQRLLGTFGKGFKDQIIPTLTAIGDVASTLGATPAAIDRVVVALSQIQGKGHVQLEELNQIREALPGFNAAAAIATSLGISIPEATKRISDGAISAQVGINAIIQGMKDFNGAAGAMDRQSLTLNGRISTLKDTLKIAATNGFGGLAEAVGKTVDVISKGISGGAFNSLISTLDTALSNVVVGISDALLPAGQNVADALGTIFAALGPAIGQVLPVITELLPPLAQILADLIPPAANVATTLLNALVPALGFLADVIDAVPVDTLTGIIAAFVGLKVAGVAEAAVTGLAGGFTKLGTALGLSGLTGVGTALTGAAGPIGAIVGVVSALALAIGSQTSSEKLAEEATKAATTSLLDSTNKVIANKDAREALIKQINSQSGATQDLLLKTSQENIRDSIISGLSKQSDDLIPKLGFIGGEINQLPGVIAQIREKGAISLGDLTDPKAAAFFGQLQTRLGLTKDQLSQFFKVIEQDRSTELLSSNIELTSEQMAGLTAQTGITETQYNALRKALSGDEPKQVAKDFLNLANAFDRIKIEDTLRSVSSTIAANIEGGAALLTSAQAITGISINSKDAAEQMKLYDEVVRLAAAHTQDLSKVKILDEHQIPDFTKLVNDLGGIKDPLTAADLAGKELLKTLDKISGKKVSQVVAQINLNDQARTLLAGGTGEGDNFKALFLQDATTKTITLDIKTTAGADNVKTLFSNIQDLAGNVVAAFQGKEGETVDSVALRYQGALENVRNSFIAAGGDAAAFDTLVRDNALDPITFKVTLDQATKTQVQTDLENLTAAPSLKAVIQTSLDQGHVDAARAQLAALTKVNTDGYIISLDPLISTDKEDAAKQELILLTLEREISLHPENAPEFVASAEAALKQLAADRDATIKAHADTAEAESGWNLFVGRLLKTAPITPVVDTNKGERDWQDMLANLNKNVRVNVGLAVVGSAASNVFSANGISAFFAGGMSRIDATQPHIKSAADTKTGPFFMYGEPSTHGEAFISYAPQYEARSKDIWERSGRHMGWLQDAGPAVGRGESRDSGTIGGMVSELSTISRRLAGLQDAFETLPPITVAAVGGSASNAAAKVWYAQRDRLRRR